MDISFESVHKKNVNKQKSIFSQKSRQQEESISDCQQSYNENIDRSCQRYLFESKQQQLEYGHQGDQDILDNCSLDGYNLSMQNIKENETNRQLKTELPISNSNNCVKEAISNSLDNSQRLLSKLDISKYESQTIIKNKESCEIDLQDKTIFTENIGNSELKNIQNNESSAQKGESSQFINKNIESSPLKHKINNRVIRGGVQSSKIHIKKEGNMSENCIQEKKQENMNKKMASPINQAQRKGTVHGLKYQQNFQKGANIINKLFNSSMNRIIRIKQIIQNFVLLLQQRTPNKKISNLTIKDYTIINDLSFYYRKYQKKKQNSFLQKHFNLILKLTQSIPILMPTDTILVLWDVFLIIYTYIFLYFYSILMFFNQDNPDSDFIESFFFYSLFLFLADILINFNTAYFDKDTIVQQRKLIAKQYIFSTLFITDCISISVQLSKVFNQSSSLVYNPNHNLLVYLYNILIFLKMNGIKPKQNRFNQVFTLKDSQKHIIKLINQLISVITVAHVGKIIKQYNQLLVYAFIQQKAAIGWYFIGVEIQANNDINWLNKLGIHQKNYYEKYIYSIYWSITTMTTVGYGDIVATNYIEALFIAISMILFSCVFAYSINNIGFILQEIEKSSKQLNDNITTIQRKNVNISLKSRVRHYLSFLAQEQKDRDKESEDQILSILSNKLRDEITIEINTKILNSYHIFSSNFSHGTLKKLIFRMKEVLVSPNEVIFSDEQYDDLSIYFIQNGVIEIYQQSVIKQGKATVIQTLSENQIFGELSFFTGLSRKASARSVNLSTLYKISREDFLEVLRENNEDYQKFKMMQEQLIFQNELSILYAECYLCRQVGHIAKACPKIHQLFDKQFIILMNNISFFQSRTYSKRSEKKIRFNVLSSIIENENLCAILKDNLENLNTEVYFMFNTRENQNSSDYCSSEENDQQYKQTESGIIDSQNTFFSQKSASLSQSVTNTKSKMLKSDKQNGFCSQKSNANYVNDEIQGNEKQQNNNNSNQKNMIYSQNKLNSLEIKENQNDSQMTEQSINNLNFQSQQENQQSKGNLYSNQNITELQKQEYPEQNNNISPKSKSFKKQAQRLAQNNFQYSFNLNKVPHNHTESNKLENQNHDFEKQHSDSEKVGQGIPLYQQPKNNSKKLLSQNSIKTFNIDNSQYRWSIDSILLQGMIVNSVLQQKRQSILQNKLSVPQNALVDKQEKNAQSRSRNEISEEVQDIFKKQHSNNSRNEEKQNKNQQKHLPVSRSNSSNANSNNQNNINESNNSGNNKYSGKNKLNDSSQMAEDINFIERISRLIQGNQLPLLFQHTPGFSLKEIQSQNNLNSMDFFDKMCNFKKFFPKNNFDKVINKLRFMQQEQKRTKKKRLSYKSRRQNINTPTNQASISNKNLNSCQLYNDDQNVNLEKYQPTYLSYGVAMKNFVVFPKNNNQLNE